MRIHIPSPACVYSFSFETHIDFFVYTHLLILSIHNTSLRILISHLGLQIFFVFSLQHDSVDREPELGQEFQEGFASWMPIF